MGKRKFLQIWEISCSSATLAAYFEERGWDCEVIGRKVFDKHECSKEFDKYELVSGSASKFYLGVIKKILRFRPSAILLRSIYQILPMIRVFAQSVSGFYAMPNDVWRLVVKDRVIRFGSHVEHKKE